MPEGGEEEQEVETSLKKIMKENFPNFMKEIDIQVQEAQRVPNKLDQRKRTPRHIISTIPTIKEKERILNAGREKEIPTKEFP